ncbi:hypothetical protein [Niveibacterium sp. SC-1]|uniref:nSTAND1 domain-containing NTPase n=1 Tax=Niveibacterium sp. SC-1 TaxID=3135646 RepID=UPI00311FEF48
MDLEEPKKKLDSINGLLVGIGALFASIAGCIAAAANLKPGLFDTAWAKPLAALLTAGLAIFVLAIWRTRKPRSTLRQAQAFELRVNSEAELVGRNTDVDDLLALLDQSCLVFLIGESGSGKSALVAHGLIPAIKRAPAQLPVLVDAYGTDWVLGPLRAVATVLWEALDPTERERIGQKDRPPPNQITCDFLATLLDSISQQLGRMPLVVFDQFDDCQVRHRARFLTDKRAWLSPRQLQQRNPLWRTLGERVRAGSIRCLFVTRSDTASGLRSVEFLAAPPTKPLDRLAAIFLNDILLRLAPVVANPESGWDGLRAQLKVDLEHDNALLPQQVRTVLLGVRELDSLDVQSYQHAGGLAGMEARYVARCITQAARASGNDEERIRAIVREMVERQDGGVSKTRSVPDLQLAGLIPDAAKREAALARLTERELIRRVPNAETGVDDWRLDHDCLAHAIDEDERRSARYSVLLREHARRWRRAGPRRRDRWRALLPLGTQIRLAWARLRGELNTYGEETRFARISLLRFAPPLLATALVSATGLVLWRDVETEREAQRIVAGLGSSKERILEAWMAPEPVRTRIAKLVIQSDDLLVRSGREWPLAVVGVDPEAALAVSRKLVARLPAGKGNSEISNEVIGLLRVINPRLDSAGRSTLRQALLSVPAEDQANTGIGFLVEDLSSPQEWPRLDDPIGISPPPPPPEFMTEPVIYAPMPSSEAEKLVLKGLRTKRPYEEWLADVTDINWLAIASNLDARQAAGLAEQVRSQPWTQLVGTQSSTVLAIAAALAVQLPKEEAARLAASVEPLMAAGSPDLSAAVTAIVALLPKLPDEEAASLVARTLALKRGNEVDWLSASRLMEAALPRASPEQMASFAQILFAQQGTDWFNARERSASLLKTMAPRLDRTASEALLRQAIAFRNTRGTTDPEFAFQAMAALAPALQASQLGPSLKFVQQELSQRPDSDAAIGALRMLVPLLPAPDIRRVAKDHLERASGDSKTQADALRVLETLIPRLPDEQLRPLTRIAFDLYSSLDLGRRSALLALTPSLVTQLNRSPQNRQAAALLAVLFATDPVLDSYGWGATASRRQVLKSAGLNDSASAIAAKLSREYGIDPSEIRPGPGGALPAIPAAAR